MNESTERMLEGMPVEFIEFAKKYRRCIEQCGRSGTSGPNQLYAWFLEDLDRLATLVKLANITEKKVPGLVKGNPW